MPTIHYTDGGVIYTGTQSPGQTSGTGSAYTLDDYEEGTWTPVTAANTNYSTQLGLYTKIGRQANCTASLAYSSTGTSATWIGTGWPFDPGNVGTYEFPCIAFFQYTDFPIAGTPEMRLNTSADAYVYVVPEDGTSIQDMKANDVGSGSYIRYTCIYQT